jgi:2,5-diamino-6-(ribosylamino)-4(3H)-pyrimidinone 5'-phosphate reductase
MIMTAGTRKGRSGENRPRTALPYVLVNMAMTADGKIATANRVVSSFGSRRDQENLLALRATADAVMAGARTVDLNQINMGPGPEKYRTQRVRNGLAEYNLRVVVSRSGTVKTTAEIFRRRFSPIIILTTERAKGRLKRLEGVADEVKLCGKREVDFRKALAWLRGTRGVRRLVCEGGGELNDALFRAGLVDELHLTVCPKIFGGRNAPTIADGLGMGRIDRAVPLKLKSARRQGEEMVFVYVRAAAASSARRARSQSKSESRLR